MSATEVTVDHSTGASGQIWWRMEYRGQYDFLEAEPTAQERLDFRRQVDLRAREAERSKRLGGSGREVTVVEVK